MTRRYDPYDDSIKGYELGIRAWREICIRRKQIEPVTREEERWAKEGDRKPSELDTVKEKRK